MSKYKKFKVATFRKLCYFLFYFVVGKTGVCFPHHATIAPLLLTPVRICKTSRSGCLQEKTTESQNCGEIVEIRGRLLQLSLGASISRKISHSGQFLEEYSTVSEPSFRVCAPRWISVWQIGTE